VPEDELLEAARQLAGEILANGALAVRLAKLNVNNAVSAGLDTALLLEQVSQAVLFESEEKHRRMTAFLERRKK
jgi:enoyl-CoA hydratase